MAKQVKASMICSVVYPTLVSQYKTEKDALLRSFVFEFIVKLVACMKITADEEKIGGDFAGGQR